MSDPQRWWGVRGSRQEPAWSMGIDWGSHRKACVTTPPGLVRPIIDPMLAVVTLSCPGPASHWPGDVPGEPLAPRPTGNAVFNYTSSMRFATAVTVPLLSVGGMPVGVQLMGQQPSAARITAIARWPLETGSVMA